MKNYLFSFFILLAALVIHLGSESFYHSRSILCIGWLIPALTAGASVAGGITNAIQQGNTNKTNLQIAGETNATNYKIMQEQNAFNEKQWNAANAYNTPSAQRQRFEDAGINPYMALSSMSSGNVQSSLTAAPAPNMVTPTMQNSTALGDSISNGLQAAAQVYQTFMSAKQAKADAQHTEIENQYTSAEAMARIDNLVSSTHSTRMQSIYQRLQNDILKQTSHNQVDLSDVSVKQAEQTLKNSGQEFLAKQSEIALNDSIRALNIKQGSKLDNDIRNSILLCAQSLRESNSRISLNSHAATSYDATAKNSLANSLYIRLKAAGINYSADQFNDLKEAAVNSAVNQSQNSYNQSQNSDIPSFNQIPGWIFKHFTNWVAPSHDTFHATDNRRFHGYPFKNSR